MEVTECTKILLNRIQDLEPESATKIIGYLLLKHTHQEMMEYAFGPDKMILSLINEAKAYLSSSPKPNTLSSMQLLPDQPPRCMSPPPTCPRSFSSPSSFRVPAPCWEPHQSAEQQTSVHNFDLLPPSYVDFIGGPHHQGEFIGFEEQLHPVNLLGSDLAGNYYYPEVALGGDLGLRTSLRLPPGLQEFPIKACHYFNKGYCKHGINCRFSHGQIIPDGLSYNYIPNFNELGNEDQAFLPGSLERLEIEIIELLRSRRGMPVSIASLPMLYLEKYGKVLQAEGYLTESQRHGKAGFSLTKLLARLKSIRLIDRPHGQHAVVLAEEAPKYMEYRNERSDQGASLGSSHQIYLTFPAESKFTEEDVVNYFRQYGPVRDVRIPRQEKRMFGFVSFHYPETVKLILAKGSPHYIGGFRVLVKPYKEKPKLADRKYAEKMELPGYHSYQHLEMDPGINAVPRLCDGYGPSKKQLIEEHEYAIELERRRLLELQLTTKQLMPQPDTGNRIDELNVPEVHVSNMPVVLNSGSTSDGAATQTSDNYSEQDREVPLVNDIYKLWPYRTSRQSFLITLGRKQHFHSYIEKEQKRTVRGRILCTRLLQISTEIFLFLQFP
ncbi:zinc finger CCCH domain-containing protein 18 isoform X3 [Elaeis guineensis]|uniref:zinc finger CCCH domain-containing protein 18 isoform X3 n=1 Tax=Elaeis guineensis var. tenera TaxID=51953 RepID=UPI003C6D80A4